MLRDDDPFSRVIAFLACSFSGGGTSPTMSCLSEPVDDSPLSSSKTCTKASLAEAKEYKIADDATTGRSEKKTQPRRKKRKGDTGDTKPTVLYRAIISASDARRTYSKVLLNAFNSCDERRLTEVLETYCVESIVGIHRYEGVQNPYGSRNVTTVKGKSLVLQMWCTLFKSAPDFFFQTLDTQCFVDKESRMVVASKFKWSGTRIMDVKVAEATNEIVLRRKLANKKRFDASELDLLRELTGEQREPIQKQDESGLFYGRGDIVLEGPEENNGNTASICFQLDKPLTQTLEMRCQGSFIVYLNDINRIYQYEFVYISMDEVEANEATTNDQKLSAK